MNAWEALVIDTFKHIQTRLEASPHLSQLGRLVTETVLIDVLFGSCVKDLTAASNTASVDYFGLGKLLATRRIRKRMLS